jgi:hypothetical protein
VRAEVIRGHYLPSAGPHHVVQITLTLWFAETAVKRRKTILKRMHLSGVQFQAGRFGFADRADLLPNQATLVRLVIQTTKTLQVT